MSSILNIVSKNSFFYSFNLIFLIFIAVFLVVFSRVDGFVWLNQFHSWYLNLFFEKITFLGDGLIIIPASVGILFFVKKHKSLALILLLSYVSSGLFVQIIKNIIIAPRPSVYFEMHHYKYYLDTFTTSRTGFSSFPSGHTASFFAFATVISIYCKSRSVCIISLILSFLVGYSRIYLANHFLIDVFAGAVIGVSFGTLSGIWLNQIVNYLAFKKRPVS